jgi:hypothetical protein
MVQQSKEKGGAYKAQQKKVLESVTEVSDIEAVIEQAEEADRVFSLDHPVPNLLISLCVAFLLITIPLYYHFSCYYCFLFLFMFTRNADLLLRVLISYIIGKV